MILLPEPHRHGSVAVEAATTRRRSTRSFRSSPLTVEEVGQLLWAAQGLSDRRGFRTVPSAGAIYPLELYLIAAEITGWEPATLRYVPESHALQPVTIGDRRPQVMRAALGQRSLAEAPAVLAIAAAFGRMEGRYRERARGTYGWRRAARPRTSTFKRRPLAWGPS